MLSASASVSSLATHETRSIHGEHNRRVTILKPEFCTPFDTTIVVAHERDRFKLS
jgi:hypothetical protein